MAPARIRSALRGGEQIWVDTAERGPLAGFRMTSESLSHGAFPETPPREGHVYLVTSRLDRAAQLLGRFADNGGPGLDEPPQADETPDRASRGSTLSLLPHASWIIGQARSSSSEGQVVVLANPSRDLDGAAAEGRLVAERFPSARAFIDGGPSASELLQAVDGAALFHFAGHAEVMGQNPYTTLLRVGPSDVLTLEHWLVARARVGLFVASGCKTAGERARPGDVGFPQGLLATGTRAVLATRVRLGDGEALSFMRDFYGAGGRRAPARGYLAAVRRARERGDGVVDAFLMWGLPTLDDEPEQAQRDRSEPAGAPRDITRADRRARPD